MRLLAACLALAFAQPAATRPQPAAEVTVKRNGEQWTAVYKLNAQAAVWVFTDSVLPREGNTSFRERTWTVETPGIRLERLGWHDALAAESGNVPEIVKIRFTPFTDDIEASYDAALAFTDGSVALYDGKFTLFPIGSAEEVTKLPIELGGVSQAESETRIVMQNSSGPVLVGAERLARADLDGSGTYVLFGSLEPTESEALATIIDPKLPGWLASYLTSALPAVLDRYAKKLGPPPGRKPLVFASWAGPTPGLTSMGGSVLDSTIVMTFQGDGLLEASAKVKSGALWFAAHEGAHFWLGQAVRYERASDSWITEGGADLLAYRAVARTDSSFDVQSAVQKALDDCIASSLKGGISTANERGDHKAYYNCGAVFGLVAEKANDGDFTGFVKQLIEVNSEDRTVSRSEWLAALESRTPGRNLDEQIGELLDNPATGPEPWAELLASAGIAHVTDADGRPRLQ